MEAIRSSAPGSGSAVMEMAAAAGITLLPDGRGDPMRASTRGVGEMIRDALDRGCRNFLIGIGGSATNDGGIGMLQALGFRSGCIWKAGWRRSAGTWKRSAGGLWRIRALAHASFGLPAM